ncbi:MAG: porin family protein [Chlorobiaceae bacterium]|jgi:opacity protein-like surface antigen|nr:porin family protein [Chlorobiaceae bacterium]
MKKTLAILAVVAAAGIVAAPAHASQRYVSAAAGISWFQDSDTKLIYQPISYTADKIAFDAGFTATAAIGCDYGSTRLEAEMGYQRNTIKDWDTGKASVYSLMANGYYDIPLGKGVEIYGMAGVGVAQVNICGDDEEVWHHYVPNNSEVKSFNNNGTWVTDYIPTHHDTHETTLAYQFGAGIAVPISKGVMLDAKYRYFATTDFTMAGSGGFMDWHGDFVPYYYETNTNISSHSVLLGLRVNI